MSGSKLRNNLMLATCFEDEGNHRSSLYTYGNGTKPQFVIQAHLSFKMSHL